MGKLRPFIKVVAGRYYFTSWLEEHFPKNYSEYEYLDVCCGGGSVFLNKKQSVSEIINDKDRGITSIFKALRDDSKTFISRLKRVKYNEKTFQKVLKRDQENDFEDYFEYGLNEFILRRMSRNGLKKSFAWTNRVRGGQPGDVNAWETMIKQLPTLASKLQNVVILNQNFQDLIRVWNEENVFMFIDPPQMPAATDGTVNELENEMSVENHIKFLNLVKDSSAKVMVCNSDHVLYSKYLNTLNGWRKVKKKTEPKISLWMNY